MSDPSISGFHASPLMGGFAFTILVAPMIATCAGLVLSPRAKLWMRGVSLLIFLPMTYFLGVVWYWVVAS